MSTSAVPIYKDIGKKFSNREGALTLIYKEDTQSVLGHGKSTEAVSYLSNRPPTRRGTETRRHFKMTTTDSDAIVFCDLPNHRQEANCTTKLIKIAICGEDKL
jgi:hypothetical protein